MTQSEFFKPRPLTEADMIAMRIPREHWECRFDKIRGDLIRHTINKFVEGLGHRINPGVVAKEGHNLLLHGANGVGKTSAGSFLLKECRRRGFSCMYMNASKYIEYKFNGEMYNDTESMARRAECVDVLLLDEFGKEMDSKQGATVRMMYALLKDRTEERKITIICMNGDPSEIKERYRESAFEVVSKNFLVIKLAGDSMRTEKQQNMLSFYKQ